MCAWSNVLTLQRSLTRQGSGNCAASHIRLCLKGQICPGWAKARELLGQPFGCLSEFKSRAYSGQLAPAPGLTSFTACGTVARVLRPGVNSVLALVSVSRSCDSAVAEGCGAEELDVGYSSEHACFWAPPLTKGRQTQESLNGGEVRRR